MSRDLPQLGRKPFIAVVDRAQRALQAHMVREAHLRGRTELKPAHNAVFARLGSSGARAADMAALNGITRQSMGEIIRDMVDLGLLEMTPDPDDRRAKLVQFTDKGLIVAAEGRTHLQRLERLFAEEFGEEEYETARDVLDRMVGLLERLEEG